MKLKIIFLVSVFLLAIINPFICEATSDNTNYDQDDVSIVFTVVPCGDCDITNNSEYKLGFSKANFTITNQSIEFSQRLTLWCNFNDGSFSISGFIDNSTLIITETYNTSVLTDCYCVTYVSGLITGISPSITSVQLQIDVNINKKAYFSTTISYPILNLSITESEITPFEITYAMILILPVIIGSKKRKNSLQ